MDTPKITEKEIAVIKRAKAGDESAFTWLFNNYKTFVETQLNLYFNDMDEARDFTNEVFLKVYQNLSKFTQYSSFGGWLRILTKNMAIDYLRQKDSALSIDDDASGITLPEEDDRGEDGIVDKMTYENILDQIKQLPPPYRDVGLLFYRDNWTIKQISRSTHIPGNTVKSYLFRMRKKFNKLKY